LLELPRDLFLGAGSSEGRFPLIDQPVEIPKLKLKLAMPISLKLPVE